MINFEGAIFDLDGTLLDSMWVWDDIDKKFLLKRGIEVPADYLENVAPVGLEGAAEYTIKRFGLKERPQDLIDEWNEMAIEAYSTSIDLKPYAKEYLIYLKNKGVKLAVATASGENLYVPALVRNGIYDLFDAFTTANEAGRGKEFPDVYLLAAKKIGIKPESCAVFEDIYAGIYGAKTGGFYCVGVYDERASYRDKIMSEADLYIYNYKEMMK